MVSIIVPCFNGEKFIDRCFRSILNQTYKDIELIVVNDGSTDDSEKIILSYEEKFKKSGIKLIYLYKENGGASSAINKGLKLVNGKYLMLLDIDDYIMQDSVKFKVEFLDFYIDYDIVRNNGYYVTEKNLNNTQELFVIDEKEKNNIYIFDDLVKANTNNWAGSYMVRSDSLFKFYRDTNIYESKYGQNLQILMPLAYKGKSGFIDIPLMKYIKQKNSVSQVDGDLDKEIKNILGYKDIRIHMVNLILKDNRQEKNNYIRIIESNYARYIMDLGVGRGNKKIVYESYNILKSLNDITLDDKILYYGLKNKPIQLVLRIYRKLFVRR